MLKRVTTTVEEERSRQEVLKNYIQKEEAALKRKAELENELARIRLERDEAAKNCTEEIVQLKAELQNTQESTEHKLQQLHQKYAKQEAEYRQAFEHRELELLAQLEGLRHAYEQKVAKSNEEGEALKKKKKIAEKDLKRLMSDFGREMCERDIDICTAFKALQKELNEKQELEEHCAKVELHKARLEEENEIARARLTHLERRSHMKQDAAVVLQSFWKGIKQREEYAILLKKASKKRGGRRKKK